MALVVEDGTIVAGANALVDATFWDAYWTARNRADLTGLSTAAKEDAILYATAELSWGYDWRGFLVKPQEQTLPFPRYSMIDDDGRQYTYPNSSSAENSAIPRRLKEAVCELGAGHVATALNEVLDRGGEVKLERVDVIVTEYFASAPSGRTFPHVENLIGGLHHGQRQGGVGGVSQPLEFA